MTVTHGGSASIQATQGALVTLTASVTSGGIALTRGQVRFCDATASYCIDAHLLGTAQLTSAGTASINIRPSLGSHMYKAVFLGTVNYLASSSSASPFQILGTSTTTSSLALDSSSNTLTATVAGAGGTSAPSGYVNLLDTTSGNADVASSSLGTGTFSLGFKNTSNPAGTSSLVGDFNGDGIPDLIANGTVLLGHGDGTFQAVLQGAGTIAGTAVGDFNGDGKLDVASASGVLLGNGDGTFTSPSTTFPAVTGGDTTIAGDFNHDGNQDLAFLTTPYGNPFGVRITTLLGNGDGTFTALPTTAPAGSHSTYMVSGDFNGDGNIDLAVAGSDNSAYLILLGAGDGSFTSAPNISSPSNYALAAGDLNGDGLTDLIGANGTYLSKGDGTFTAVIPFTGSIGMGGNFSAVGDFNADGKLDLALPSYGGEYLVVVALGNGDGTLGSTFGAGSTVNSSASNLSIADFNGDGYPDLVAGNQFNGTTLKIFLSQPTLSATGTFSNFQVVGTGTHQLVADYDGDSSHGASSSDTVGLTAQMINPTLTLTVNPGGSAYGQQIVLSATISVANVQNHTTTGQTVLFYNGRTLLGTAFLNTGLATLNTTSLPAGTASLTAVYRGDANFAAATSSPVSYTVTGTVPTIVFAVGGHTFGDAPFAVAATSNSTGALSYAVISGPASITGSTVTLSGAGTVVLQANQTAAGPYMSGSQQTSFSVSASGQSISFPVLSSPVAYGVSPIVLTATSTSGLAVSFSVISGPGTISGDSLAVSGVGTVVVAANQAGNGNYTAATQVTQMVLVNAATPVVSFAQPSGITYGTGLGGILTASAVSAGASVPGTFSYKTGSTSLTASTILGAGSYPLVATFTPADTTRYSTANASATLTVNKAMAVVALTSGSNPGQVQNAVPLTATVSSTVSTPTGSVTFFDGGAMIGNSALTNGNATLSIAFSAGSHSITAMYGGDANFVNLTSTAVVQSVEDFNLASTGTTPSQTVSGGSVANYSLAISPVNGSTFPATVTFTASGLPAGATATFTPQTIAAGSGMTNVTLAIQTVKLTSRVEHDLRGRLEQIALALLLPITFAMRKSRRHLSGLSCLLVLGFVAAGGLVGCSSGNNSSTTTTPTSPTSPTPQSYTVTVTASSGMLTHAITLGLTVQ